MKKQINILIIVGIAIGIIVSSCVKRDFDTPEVPDPCLQYPAFNSNITILEIQKLYNDGNLNQVLNEVYEFPKDSNFILEATVVSSDKTGNFYKEMFIQDSTGTMKISIDMHDIYGDFDQGQVVLIKLTGLNVDKDTWSAIFTLGMGLYEESSLGRIPEDSLPKYMFRKSCPRESNLSPKVLEIGKFYDLEVGKLVKFNNVEFSAADSGKTYFDEKDAVVGTEGNRTIQDCTGAQILVRTSKYATFAFDTIPYGNGSLVGILGKYGSDYQLYIVNEKDVDLVNPRCY